MNAVVDDDGDAVADNDGGRDPLEEHRRRGSLFQVESQRHERTANRLSLARLLSFLAGAAALSAGVSQGSLPWLTSSAVLFACFAAAVILHLRTLGRSQIAQTRESVHRRHEARLTGSWSQFDSDGSDLLPKEHPYARDIDLVGRGSLFQRIDVTHTVT